MYEWQLWCDVTWYWQWHCTSSVTRKPQMATNKADRIQHNCVHFNCSSEWWGSIMNILNFPHHFLTDSLQMRTWPIIQIVILTILTMISSSNTNGAVGRRLSGGLLWLKLRVEWISVTSSHLFFFPMRLRVWWQKIGKISRVDGWEINPDQSYQSINVSEHKIDVVVSWRRTCDECVSIELFISRIQV